MRFTPTGVGTACESRNQNQSFNRFTPTGVGTAPRMSAMRPAISGSPPRVWGQPECRALSTALFPVHPHGCGDSPGVVRGVVRVFGSPPRVWGQRNFEGLVACTYVGSPPRVWGQRVLLLSNVVRKRFTPTGVGTARQRRTRRPAPFRFTPTGVGTASTSRLRERWLAVHPHGCGDSCQRFQQILLVLGSPPRVWGQLILTPYLRLCLPVHPHGCGDSSTSAP